MIDLVVGLPRLSDAEDRFGVREVAGYEYARAYEKQLPEHRPAPAGMGGPSASVHAPHRLPTKLPEQRHA